MEIKYKNGYLQEWMKANKKNRKDILEAIGTQDYKTCNKWFRGEIPIPVDYMTVICSKFNIDMGEFFTIDGRAASLTDHFIPQGMEQAAIPILDDMKSVQMQLAHEHEIRQINNNARDREDAIRRECDLRYDTRQDKLYKIIENQARQIDSQAKQIDVLDRIVRLMDNNRGYNRIGIAADDGDDPSR